jgi:hypothetical protein
MASLGSFASVFIPVVLGLAIIVGGSAMFISKRREARRIKAHFRNKRA